MKKHIWLTAVTLAAASALPAATLYWDTNGATVGSGNANGTWDATTSAWTTDSTGATVTTVWGSAADTAVFAAGTDFTGTRTVTVSGSVALAGVTVENEVTSLLITGGTLDYGAATGFIDTSAWGTTSGKTFTLSSLLTGTGGLTIASNGNLTASGGSNSSVTKLGNTANTFTGDVTITSGLVAYAADGSFGNSANKIILNGGGLLDNSSGTGPALARAIEVQAGGGTIRLYGSASATWSSTITGTGNLNRTDGGTLTFTGDLSGYAGTFDNQSGTTVVNGSVAAGGNWKVSGGTLQIGSNGLASGGTLTLNGGTLASNAAAGTGDRTLANAVSVSASSILGGATNTGVLTLSGAVDLGAAARTLTINSAVILSGAVNNGTLLKAGAATLTLAGNSGTAGATVTAGTLAVTGTDSIGAGAVVNAGTLSLDYSANDTGKIVDSASLTLAGGTVSLTGGTHTEIVSGTTLIAGTTSAITRTSGSAKIALGAITRGSGALLNISGDGVAQSTLTPVSGNLGAWLTIGGASLATVDGSNNIVAVTYADVATGGTLNDGATDQTRITGAAGTVTIGAGTTVSTGSLTRTAAGVATLDTTGKTLRIVSGAVLSGTGSGGLTFGTAANAGKLTAGAADNTAGTLEFNATAGNIVVNSTVADNGTGAVIVSKIGTSELHLTGMNTYTGGTLLAGGTLRVGDSAALGTGTLSVNSSSTLAAIAGTTAPLRLANNVAVSSGSTLTVAPGNAPITLRGVVSDAGNLSSGSTGVVTLTGANTYTGTTTIGAGNNSVFSGIRLGDGGATGNLGTGAIIFGGYGNNLIYNRSGAMTLSTGISGAGSLIVKSGTLTLTAGGSNSYSGDTVVQGGQLNLSAGNSQNIGSSRLLVYTGATVANTTTHVFGIGTATAVQLLGGTFAANGNEFYIGNLDMAGGALTSTSGEFRFSASRTINVLPSATASTITRTLAANAIGTNTVTFLINDGPAANDLDFTKNISSAGAAGSTNGIVKTGLGTLRFTTNTAHGYAGATVVNAGTLNLDFSASTLAGNMIASTNALTLGGGNLTLTGKSAATAVSQTLGAVTLNAGGSALTLAGATGGASLTTGALTRNTGATLAVNTSGTTTLTLGTGPALTNGILAYAVVNGNDFATHASGVVSAYSAYASDDYSAAANNVNVTTASPAPATFSVNSLAFRTAQANTLTLAGANTVGAVLVGSAVGANDTTITGGTLQGTAGGELIIQQFNTAGVLAIGSAIVNNTGATALVKAGPGTLVLSGVNTYTGATYLNGGLLQFSAQNNIGNSTGAIVFGGGGLRWATGSTVDVSSGRSLTIGAGGATFDTNGNNVTLGTAFATGSTGTLTKTGAGKLTLGAGNTNFSGSVVVNQGELAVTNGSGLGAGTLSQSILINAGGTLTLSTNTLSANHSAATARSIYVNGGTLQNASGATLRIGNIWLNGGTLNTQNGGDANYTTFYLGTLQANTQGANATVFVEGSTASQITTTGSSNNGLQLGPNVLFQVADVTGNANADLTVSAPLQNQSADQGSAAAALTKRGAGTMAIAAQSTYTGGTFVEQGVLDLTGGGGGSGTIRGAVTVESGATLRLSTGDATGYNADGTQLSSINLNGGTLQVNTDQTAGKNQTLGNAAINMTGATITGIAGSNLDFYNGASALNTLASATTSTISGVKLSIRQTPGLTITVADGAAATDLQINSVIANDFNYTTAPLIKAGAGKLVLAGVNTYTGKTTVAAGTLEVTGTVQVNGAAGITVATGATLAFNGTLKLTSDSDTLVNNGTLTAGGILDLGGLFNTFNGGSTGAYNLITGTAATGGFSSIQGYDGGVWQSVGFDAATGLLTFTAVPEPATYGILGAGALAAMAVVRRRRARRG